MNIEIISITPTNDGNHRADISFRIADKLIVNRARWVQQPGQRGYVQPPVLPRIVHGKIYYDRIVEWPTGWTPMITDAVAEYLRDHPDGIEPIEPRTEPRIALGVEVQRRAGLGKPEGDQ